MGMWVCGWVGGWVDEWVCECVAEEIRKNLIYNNKNPRNRYINVI